jgi:hypothetical protein
MKKKCLAWFYDYLIYYLSRCQYNFDR